ncbi:spore germination protein [Paenibacillus beijingensis]|uniref:Spore gernimation protein GerPA n=1 Tax=Paenibacillus beijingensis TaxID=1126833 RepID=A0A0D5NPR2_9BACL|nr:spore germination protein [Paenibacillus beijingensis]AJY77294.1 spore gernimation protein GerPA [Paenibacillus beijingensis]
MPSVVGFVNIVSIGSSGVVQFGDTVQVSPSSTSKTYAGSGSFLTGSLANANNGVSATNTLDPDVQDSPNNKVAAGAGNVV